MSKFAICIKTNKGYKPMFEFEGNFVKETLTETLTENLTENLKGGASSLVEYVFENYNLATILKNIDKSLSLDLQEKEEEHKGGMVDEVVVEDKGKFTVKEKKTSKKFVDSRLSDPNFNDYFNDYLTSFADANKLK